jgi:AcrR family transcriptional regulator
MARPIEQGRAKVSREELLDAAAGVFFEQGYAGTAIDAVIARAGGSKRNIYSEFGNKEGLFTALVTEHVGRALSPLAVEGHPGQVLRVTLESFGTALLKGLLSPALLGVYRIAVTERARFPDLVRRFYELGPGHASARLTGVLEAAQERGDIRVSDCEMAADQFVGLVRGNLHLQVVLGLRAPPGPKELDRWVAAAVDIFLDGVRAAVLPDA